MNRIVSNSVFRVFNLLDLLKDNNIIHRRIFSFYKSDKDTRSFYLGDYPPEIEAKPDKTSTCQVSQYIPHSKYKDNWICSLTHGLLGKEVNFTNTFEIDDYVVFNTGYDYILAPNRYLNLYKQ